MRDVARVRDVNGVGRLLELLALRSAELFHASGLANDPDLRFWHYRDKDRVEVDLVVTRGGKTWGIEVKAAATIGLGDGQGLRRLADRCGHDFESGVLLYAGRGDVLPLGDPRILAVPLSELWER